MPIRSTRLFVLLSVLLASTGCLRNWLDEIKDAQTGEVDLGLPSGVIWATHNIQAIHSWDFGSRYAWGETGKNEPRPDAPYLDSDIDIASVTLGEEWRLPTPWEYEELLEFCTFENERRHGVDGVLFTSKLNSKSIFVPVQTHVEEDPRNPIKPIVWKESSEDDEILFPYYWTSFAGSCDAYVFSPGVIRYDGVSSSLSDKPIFEKSKTHRLYVRAVKAGRTAVNGISVMPESVSLNLGRPIRLNVSISPAGTFDKRFQWEVDNPSVATVDDNGIVYAHNVGKVIVSAVSPSGKKASSEITVHDYIQPSKVDLGLPSGVLWSPVNLGASDEDTEGCRFAWGGIRPIFGDNDEDYVNRINYESGSNFLAFDDDAAAVLLGNGWRMPTPADFRELMDNCTISCSETGDDTEFVLKSKNNGATLTFPVTKSKSRYWTSQMHSGNAAFYFSPSVQSKDNCFAEASRSYAYFIRPVFGEGNKVSEFRKTASRIRIYLDEQQVAPISYHPVPGDNTTIQWSSSNEFAAKVSPEGIIKARNRGRTTITAYSPTSQCYASCDVLVPGYKGLKAVDMGTPSGVKWGSCNLGATEESELGVFLSWGEISPKDNYSYETYTRVCDDPVTAILGEGWRTPTVDDFRELMGKSNCSQRVGRYQYSHYEYFPEPDDSPLGWEIINSRTNNRIFLPAGGYMEGNQRIDPEQVYYWCYSSEKEQYVRFVYQRGPSVDEAKHKKPYVGMQIRPVYVGDKGR